MLNVHLSCRADKLIGHSCLIELFFRHIHIRMRFFHTVKMLQTNLFVSTCLEKGGT